MFLTQADFVEVDMRAKTEKPRFNHFALDVVDEINGPIRLTAKIVVRNA